jgi:flagellar assembly protein FliH
VLKYYQAQVDDANKVTVSTKTDINTGETFHKEERSRSGITQDEMSKVEEMFERAQRGAQSIVEAAHRSAARIVDEAHQQAETIAEKLEKEATDRGFAEGHKKGSADGQRLLAEAEAVLEDAKQHRQEIIPSVEGEVVELIAKLLSKLLANTIEINPQVVTMLVRGQLLNMNATGNVTIRVSPEDYDEVVSRREEIASAVDASVKIEIVKDVTFKKAECILETPLGSVDISLESSYRTLRENLMYLFKMGELHDES